MIDTYIYDKVSNNVDCRLLWDVLKIEIREATIIYCKSKSKFKRESRRSLEKELQDLSSHRDSLDITDESLDKRINDIEKELEQMYKQKAKGAQIRSREKWVELGEQNNSYLLGLEKQRQDKKYISKLLDENNKVIKDQGEKYLTQLRTTMKNIIRRKKQMKFLQKYIFLIQN
jgi:septal ring factor EnvC (AmiA/AmiB activator)